MIALLAAAAVASANPFLGVPADASLAIAAPRADQAGQGLRAFLLALARRSALFAPSRHGEAFARRLGFDPLDLKTMEAAGLDSARSLAWFMTRAGDEGVVARVRDGKTARAWFKRWLAGRQELRVVTVKQRGLEIKAATVGRAEDAHLAWAVAGDTLFVYRGKRAVPGVASMFSALLGGKRRPLPAAHGALFFSAKTLERDVVGSADCGSDGLVADATILGATLLTAGPRWSVDATKAIGVASMSLSSEGLRRLADLLTLWTVNADELAPTLTGPAVAVLSGLHFDPPATRKLELLPAHAWAAQVSDEAAARRIFERLTRAPWKDGERQVQMQVSDGADGLHAHGTVGGRALYFGVAGGRVYRADSAAGRDAILAATAAAPSPDDGRALVATLNPPRLAAALAELGLLQATQAEIFQALYAARLELNPLLNRTDPFTLTARLESNGSRVVLTWPAPRP